MKNKIFMFYLLFSNLAFSAESSLKSLKGDQSKASIDDLDHEFLYGDISLSSINIKSIDLMVKEAAEKFEQEKLREINYKKKRDQEEDKRRLELAKKIKKLQEVPVVAARVIKKKKPVKKTIRYKRRGKNNPTVTVFNSNLSKIEDDYEKIVVIPSGSHALATVLYGEDVSPGEKNRSILLEVKTKFLGPNNSFVSLENCRAFAKIEPQFASEKIRASIEDLTCRCPKSGAVFTVQSPGILVSAKTNYAGVKSNLIMGSVAKKALLDFSQNLLKGMGKAFQFVNSTTDLSSSEKSTEKSTNFKGSKTEYLKGRILEAQGDFLNTMNSFYAQAAPRLAIAPGEKIIMVLRKNIEIPLIFFKEIESEVSK
jgi:hypothetical protein